VTDNSEAVLNNSKYQFIRQKQKKFIKLSFANWYWDCITSSE